MKKYFLNGKTNESESHSLTDLQILGFQESDFIWFEGLDTWKPVGEIEELQPYIKEKVVPPPFQPNPTPPLFTDEWSEKSNSTKSSMPYEDKDRPGGWIYLILVLFSSVILYLFTRDLNIFSLLFFRALGIIIILYVCFLPFRFLFRKEYPDVIKNEKSLIPSEFAKLIDYLKEGDGDKITGIFIGLHLSLFMPFINSCDLWVREITGWNHPTPGTILGLILSFIPLFLIIVIISSIYDYNDKNKK